MMFPTLIFAVSLAALSETGPGSDVKSFLDLVDSLQPQIEDFRCEYEGTITLKDRESIKINHLNDNGLLETFSGIFIRKANGDTVYDAFRRGGSDGKMTRDTMIITGLEARQYVRLEDEPLGDAVVDDAYFTNENQSHSLGSIFLIDTMKRYYASDNFDAMLEESNREGRPCSILTFREKPSGRLHERFFVDMKKGGLVYRREGFMGQDQLQSRTTIDLARFPVGNSFAWMPVAGLCEGFMRMESDKRLTFYQDPIYIAKIYLVNGTLQFNLHPPQSTFTAKYEPGTVVTDNLRQMQYEFGQLKPHRTTRAEAESQLRGQLAEAESQKAELIAESPARGTDWSTTLAWTFAAFALVTSIGVIFSRRK